MDSTPQSPSLPPDYPRFLAALKERIRTARLRAAMAVNRELILLYWDIGRRIVDKQKSGRWGTAILERIAVDLRVEFPEMNGFSRRNIHYMRAFYLAWFEASPILQQPVGELRGPIVQQLVAQLPWGHNIALIDRLKSRAERLWYAKMALENGWSRRVLIQQIGSRLHLRQGKAQTNFALTLPAPQAKLAQETLKDEYALDFLASGTTQEKDIEQGIIENAQKFLMELGKGFAFIGRQAGPFKAEQVGKLSSYLSAADEVLRRPGDDASIGMILCRSKNRVAVEYALRDQRKPIGVACYRLTKALPGRLSAGLPSARELEERLNARPPRWRKRC